MWGVEEFHSPFTGNSDALQRNPRSMKLFTTRGSISSTNESAVILSTIGKSTRTIGR